MTPDAIRKTGRTLAALLPGQPPLRFLFVPDDGEGKAQLVVDRERIDPRLTLGLVRNGASKLVEGTISRTPDGFLSFASGRLNEGRLAKLVAALEPSLPIVAGARLGA